MTPYCTAQSCGRCGGSPQTWSPRLPGPKLGAAVETGCLAPGRVGCCPHTTDPYPHVRRLSWLPVWLPLGCGPLTRALALQTVQDGRQFLKYVDPRLGVPLPERDYGGNCLIYDADNKTDPFHNIWVRVPPCGHHVTPAGQRPAVGIVKACPWAVSVDWILVRLSPPLEQGWGSRMYSPLIGRPQGDPQLTQRRAV